ncbi:MAG: molybdopterin biosynthesis protein [Euryarchaeota archaeon]|nr:molybdopterin biosynthesis protein [Euryarchaeota archaeon]MBU4491226.1 molybdopterin biosynthesis protein [Euryarchaeota archaeon]MCG2727137.1 molybdopterin biosynthesis protein [Candidatus Methanoperedenaceae archaeon]
MHVRKEFRKLISMDEAKGIIQHLDIQPHLTETDIENALGCVLAEDAVSEVDVPPFNRASMDGYAVHASDTYVAREDMPVKLKLVGSIPAGINPDIHINRGEAAEIATGAVMPGGADSVVMVEYTSIDRDLHVHRPVSINENVMPAGADIMVGERVLKKGTRLSAREIGVLAAIGKKRICVYGLNVGIISTGNELAEPGRKLEAGKIYDINSFSLSSGVKECGGIPIRYNIIMDDENEMKNAIKEAAENCDIILTSGSTSAGSGDIMYRIIEENGILLAHGIDIKPGKPAIIGKVFGKPVVGLPGYPASSLIIFNEFVAPLIRKMTGKNLARVQTKATLAARIRSEGRSQLLPVGIVRGLAYPIEKGSGAITTLSEADGFIEVPSNVEMIDAGETVNVTLFGKPEAVELLFVGSHCLGLDTIADLTGLKMRIINAGSSGGLNAIQNGTADIAGVHLLDESGVYNIPYLERFGINNAVIVKGYLREQGLIARKDSSIEGFEDIINARIINRNTGSGTRVITDLKLEKIAEQRGVSFEELINSIDGYHTEAKTHSAIAAAVKLGKADVGIGIRPVAEMNGLKFIKIADEEYDFVIPQKLLESREIKLLLEVLHGKEFREKLPAGLKVYERTGEIVQVFGSGRPT